MANVYILIEQASDWKPYYPSDNLITAQDYLLGKTQFDDPSTRIINLCPSYKYLSVGYYCSLLAEARGDRAIPSVRAMNDLAKKAIYSLHTDDLDDELQKALKSRVAPDDSDETFTLNVYFGKTDSPELQDFARQIFETFPCPLLKVIFHHLEGKWEIHAIKPESLTNLNDEQEDLFASALDGYCKKVWRKPKSRKLARYDLAILHNPQEQLPPSSAKALQNFIRVGKTVGMDVELIEKRHYSRLAEYDALFIRETTGIDHHTYRFAKKAESEGMVVIDDPTSILRCTNKVYLADLLKTNKIPAPKTLIVQKSDPGAIARIEEEIGYPAVLKIPDGSFSRGVMKAADRQELIEKLPQVFKNSEVVLAQQYLYTDYDWRIGILNNKPIFACQYFMSKGHWQIVKHGPQGNFSQGAFKTFPTAEAPKDVIKWATKAAGLIGDGLYGVDVKQTPNGVYVIEINDNPNLDAGVEDEYLEDDLYKIVLEDFIRRLEDKRSAQ